MIKVLNERDIIAKKDDLLMPYHANYLAMFSSILGGIVKEPMFMTIPIDDHMVHRGDGVFEVIKCQSGWLYQIDAHLKRLERSAKIIDLKLPLSCNGIKEVVRETIKAGGERDCIVRIFVSRGPGGFGINPLECIKSQIYVIVTRPNNPPLQYYTEGVKIIISKVPIKPGIFAQVKSCNYLPNVMMKKEAIESGAHYAVLLDENGFLAEGSTESIGILSDDNCLKFPKFGRVLKSITVSRVATLAKSLVRQGVLKDIVFADIPVEEVYRAKEVFLLGTTIDVLPVIWFEGKKIGCGRPGPVAKTLKMLIEKDIFCKEVSERIL